MTSCLYLPDHYITLRSRHLSNGELVTLVIRKQIEPMVYYDGFLYAGEHRNIIVCKKWWGKRNNNGVPSEINCILNYFDTVYHAYKTSIG
jgi:hypothetical protein